MWLGVEAGDHIIMELRSGGQPFLNSDDTRRMQWSSIAAISFNAMVFLLMVRVQDSQLPRAIIGTLNTLLFFPSGAVYPEQAFPRWLRVIARLDPFTYAVDGLKALLLREAGLHEIIPDVIVLLAISIACLLISVPLFDRHL